MAGYLVSGSDDGSLRLWSVATGTAVGDPLLGHAEAVRSVAFSPDGRFVVSAATTGPCAAGRCSRPGPMPCAPSCNAT